MDIPEKKANTYQVGTKVPCTGTYICVPCGYKCHLGTGERFPACIRCMSVSHDVTNEELIEAQMEGLEIDEFAENLVAPNLETWELVEET